MQSVRQIKALAPIFIISNTRRLLYNLTNIICMKRLILCWIFSNSLFIAKIFSQTLVADQLITTQVISSETIYVHFDKDIYLPGETIWFKAYLYNVNEISYTATNFYTAIYDDKGKLIQRKQYPIFEGSCNGDFKIPDTIQSSRIQFRAFTKAMIIEDSNNVYEKVLTVYKKETEPVNFGVSKSINLQFYPEGGQMIAELENHVVFKARYATGSPAIIHGKIMEAERDKVVDTFFTNSMGVGKFILIPSPRKKYVAQWNDENGAIRQTPLPTINRYGVSFHAEIVNRMLQYSIVKNRGTDTLSNLHLLAQMGNYLVYKADLSLPNEMEIYTVTFSIDSLPAGLMQLTLFDKYWMPLQQRLMFINNDKADRQFAITRDTISNIPKGKNSIEINLPDTLFTNLSASIADINFYDRPNTHSINQDLYFNTQLEEVNINTNSILQTGNNAAIDMVILSHNWKKYNWKKLINKDSLNLMLLDNYLTLVIDYKEKNLALPKDDALNIILNSKPIGKQFFSLKPISKTGFKKKGLIFFDSVKVSYQMDKNKELVNNLTISKEETIEIPSSINLLKSKVQFVTENPVLQSSMFETFVVAKQNKFNDEQTIKEVIVKSRHKGNPQLDRIDELDKFYTTGMFSGTVRGYQLNVIDDPMAKTNNNIADYVQYRVPGVKVWVDPVTQEKYFVAAESISAAKKQLSFVPVFLDEMRVDNVGDVDFEQVAYIKYIPGIVIGASFKSIIGAVYIYRKKGNEVEPPVNNMRSVYIKGYDLQKEFSSPDYSDKDLLKRPDLRTTLYWNPNIIMDKANNKVKIEYYNNDVSKKLLLIIEGINEKGRFIHVEKVID